jgi:hypothetical protein
MGPTAVKGTRADLSLGFTDPGRAVAIYAAPWDPTGWGEWGEKIVRFQIFCQKYF